ncbi:leucine-rich repeat-containing protein 2 isoform X4 [Mesocricetus auratus]|uniref:Leucine-rich repeat-containing protein 2 isoform X4 n=1 Tax=Mesocricetus auratus TaxID=10036 RepID=A0ABM2WZL9_MESAU|nr:leucine-rich repeat-containing protein 2 isoform X4 [Mesocricetus auratus]XP_040596102.1 leucine-rich repeat-containing protein 2 isoform X4 [Mesocricetus auratus]
MWQQNFAAEGDVYRSRQPMHSCVVSSRPDWTIGDSATKTQTKRRWRLQIDLRRIKEEWDFVAECRRKGVPQAQYCKNGFVDTNTRLLDKIERNSVARQRSRVKDRDKRSNPFVFELSGAQWKELPDSLKEQTHLKEWHIHSTRIQTIPAYIKLFQAMKILDLPKNQITCLPAEIGRLKNLKELNVSFNHLRSIPPELGDCENLERLDCSGNLDLMELPFEKLFPVTPPKCRSAFNFDLIHPKTTKYYRPVCYIFVCVLYLIGIVVCAEGQSLETTIITVKKNNFQNSNTGRLNLLMY